VKTNVAALLCTCQLLVLLASGCAKESESKALLADVSHTYRNIESCVLQYSVISERSGLTTSIKGTVYAKRGNLRQEEELVSLTDTLRQIRVYDGKTFYRILPQFDFVRTVDMELGADGANSRLVARRGALASVLPIPDEKWEVKKEVRTQGRGQDTRLVVEASPPASRGELSTSYTFFVEPESHLIREIEFVTEERARGDAGRTANKARYWDYDTTTEIPDSLFVVVSK
jgi:outer membrane lipoprotein-sorting protein